MNWDALDADRNGFQTQFIKLALQHRQFKGRVLDIGCGPTLPPYLAGLAGNYGSLDGVDMDPSVREHPLLTHRWNERFETSHGLDNCYDFAFAYNVLEHIAEPRPF